MFNKCSESEFQIQHTSPRKVKEKHQGIDAMIESDLANVDHNWWIIKRVSVFSLSLQSGNNPKWFKVIHIRRNSFVLPNAYLVWRASSSLMAALSLFQLKPPKSLTQRIQWKWIYWKITFLTGKLEVPAMLSVSSKPKAFNRFQIAPNRKPLETLIESPS